MTTIRPEEIKRVTEALSAFINTANSYTLYPSGHIVIEESLEKLISSLKTFFDAYTNFKIDVKRDGLFFKDVKVQSFSNINDSLCLPLFRDGVLWFEFLPGITPKELDKIFKILGKYRILNEEPEEDIVTSLWNANLQNFNYKAVDSYIANQPKFSYNDFKIYKNAESENKINRESPVRNSVKSYHSNTLKNFFELTIGDKELLQNLVDQDRLRKKDEDLVDILNIILRDSSLEEELAAILDLLKEEFKESISSAKFELALKIISSIKTVYFEKRNGPDNYKKPIYDFWLKISGNEIAKPLESGLSKIDPHNIVFFRKTILMLHPDIIFVLANFLCNTHFNKLTKLLMQVIRVLGTKNIAPIENLFKSKDENLLRKLIIIAAAIKTPQAVRLLSKTTGHESEIIRLKALIELIKRDKLPKEIIFELINDTSYVVRSRILQYLAKKKDIINERMIRDHIESINPAKHNYKHIFMCYKTLGKCGSNSSLDFLKYHLFKRPCLGFFSQKNTIHRKGAAIALFELGTSEAKAILKSASRSLFPSLRRAYKTALEMNYTTNSV
jgi:hypothetical protein